MSNSYKQLYTSHQPPSGADENASLKYYADQMHFNAELLLVDQIQHTERSPGLSEVLNSKWFWCFSVYSEKILGLVDRLDVESRDINFCEFVKSFFEMTAKTELSRNNCIEGIEYASILYLSVIVFRTYVYEKESVPTFIRSTDPEVLKNHLSAVLNKFQLASDVSSETILGPMEAVLNKVSIDCLS